MFQSQKVSSSSAHGSGILESPLARAGVGIAAVQDHCSVAANLDMLGRNAHRSGFDIVGGESRRRGGGTFGEDDCHIIACDLAGLDSTTGGSGNKAPCGTDAAFDFFNFDHSNPAVSSSPAMRLKFCTA